MNTAVKSLIIPHFITLYSVVKTVMQTQLNTGQIQNKYFLFSVSFVLQQKIEMWLVVWQVYISSMVG